MPKEQEQQYPEYHSTVFMAGDILDMYGEIQQLRLENEDLLEYKKKYTELLKSSTEHGQAMMGMVLEGVLSGGIETKKD